MIDPFCKFKLKTEMLSFILYNYSFLLAWFLKRKWLGHAVLLISFMNVLSCSEQYTSLDGNNRYLGVFEFFNTFWLYTGAQMSQSISSHGTSGNLEISCISLILELLGWSQERAWYFLLLRFSGSMYLNNFVRHQKVSMIIQVK